MYLSLIRKSQKEVLRYCRNKYYKHKYMGAEINYWRELVQHIYERQSENIKNCLDIGCAYGTLAVYLKKLFNNNVHCIDFSPHYLGKELVEKVGLSFAISNIELDTLPWNTKYDIILLTEVLEHFNFHPLPTLKKISDLLSENGTLYISTPNADYLGKVTKYYSSIDDMPIPDATKRGAVKDDHIYVYDELELCLLFQQAGLEIVVDFSHRKHLQYVLKKKSPFASVEEYLSKQDEVERLKGEISVIKNHCAALQDKYYALANSKLGRLQVTIWERRTRRKLRKNPISIF